MSDSLRLWYRQPARIWEETLPIGNGSLGAMIFGGVRQERLGLNEDSLWSGYARDKNNPGAYEHLQSVREKIFAGRYRDAEREILGGMMGEHTDSYLPLGDLLLQFDASEPVSSYERALDLDTAVATVRYTAGGVHFAREYVASFPHHALLMRLTSSAPAGFSAAFASKLMHTAVAFGREIRIDGQCPEYINQFLADEPVLVQGEKGLRFQARVQVLATDGEIHTEDDVALRVEGATETLLAFSAVRPAALPAVSQWPALLAAHLADYRPIFDACRLDLGPQPEQPTDERLAALRAGADDSPLFALYFAYGRYLLIASSRAGGLPANLQGIWCWQLKAPWSSNFTININTEMNYWPALSCNLLPCLAPYNDFMLRLCEQGKKTAAVNYHARGFVAHHNTDRWFSTNPVGIPPFHTQAREQSVRWGIWPMGGAWLCEQLYYEYVYTGDKTFLRDVAFPVTREAALFLLDWVVEHDGVWTTAPSTSPENAFLTPEGEKCPVGMGSTMDLTIVREVWLHYAELSEAMGLREDSVLDEIREKLPKLAGFQIGEDGRLLEYHQPFDEPEPGHRHVSHLYGLFPSELFAEDEALREACRRSLLYRLENGGGHTGWSCAWIVNLFAVLGDAENAEKYLGVLLRRSTCDNLWDQHPPFQIDGNFGGIAGIANLLVQDRGGRLTYLPALPKSWRTGRVRGLRIKGGRTVDLAWEDGRLTEAQIHND